MKIINESRKEEDFYFQGPFWIIADSFLDIIRGNFTILAEKYLSDYEGNYLEKDAISKSARTHKNVWENEYKSYYNNVDFDYYPRGRVSIYKGNAFIHLNSRCNLPKIIDSIVDTYNIDKLTKEIDLNDLYQGSHYNFKLE